jgi:uncharacterized damage-inducible protein DinB
MMQQLDQPDLDKLRYPIGRFDVKATVGPDAYGALIDRIAACPARMRDAVADLDDAQLDTPYREGGWTVRRLVHHVADSHVNAYVRFKLGVTEDSPRIKTYDQERWAGLADSRLPIDVSLDLLESIHTRWVALLRDMRPDDFDRKLEHPEMGTIPLEMMLRLYAWHSEHHVTHVTALRARKNW